MNINQMEDLALLMVGDRNAPAAWFERWICSYPIVRHTDVSPDDTPAVWRQQVSGSVNAVYGNTVMAIAYGAGAAAFLAWYNAADIHTQRAIKGIILVSPDPDACRVPEAAHTRLMTERAVVVVGETDPRYIGDWLPNQAQIWYARLLYCPNQSGLAHYMDGWQWGMKLMQEMLLDG